MSTQPKVIIIKKCDGEYRVPSPDGREAGAYYTCDREDAENTALHMHAADWRTTIIKFRSVKEM